MKVAFWVSLFWVADTTTDAFAPVSRRHTTVTALHASRPQDIQVQLGSEEDTTAANDDEFEEDDPETQQRAFQTKAVQELLDKSNESLKEIRKSETWGKFSDVSSSDDLDSILESERRVIAEQFAELRDRANSVGIEMQVLEPRGDDDNEDGIIQDGNVRINIGSNSGNNNNYQRERSETQFRFWVAVVGLPVHT